MLIECRDGQTRVQFRFGLNAPDIGAESAYGRGEVLTGFMEAAVNVYTPKPSNLPKGSKHKAHRELISPKVKFS